MSTVLRLKNQPWNFPYSPECFLLPPPCPGHSFCPERPACPFSCLISQCSWQLSWTPSLATHNHSKGYTHSAGRNSLIQHFYGHLLCAGHYVRLYIHSQEKSGVIIAFMELLVPVGKRVFKQASIQIEVQRCNL